MANEWRRVCGVTRPSSPARPRRRAEDPPPLPGEAAAALVQEQGRPRPRSGQAGPCRGEVGADGARSRGGPAAPPLLAPLADRPHAPLVEVEVVDVQPDGLRDAETGAVQQFDDGPVPEAGRLLGVGRRTRRSTSTTVSGWGRSRGTRGRATPAAALVAFPSSSRNRWRLRTAANARATELAR